MVTFVPSFVNEEVRSRQQRLELERSRLERELKAPSKVQKRLEAWKRKNPPPGATLSNVADHVDHIRRRIGIEHIGIGSDFDGIRSVPLGLEDVADFPALFVELLERGYQEDELRRIAGDNFLRVIREAEAVRDRLSSRQPSGETIERLDTPAAATENSADVTKTGSL